MNAHTVNTDQPAQNRGIYQGASVMRLDDRGRPTRIMMQFPSTPEAVAFCDEIYAAGTKAEFGVWESYSYPVA